MDLPELSLKNLARGAATVAGLLGVYHFLYLMGAFRPVSCWRSVSESGTASQNGTETSTTPTVTQGCESGIDAVLGSGGPSGGGNAEILFSWGFVLLVLVGIGVFGTWTERVYLIWGTVLVSAVITVIGMFSIGWYFLLPTVLFLIAGVTLSVRARNE